jgi:AraC family transcriptional regulator
MTTHLSPGNYYGQTLRSRKVASFELTERVYSPGYQTPEHTHKQALFCFVMEGCYTETYGGKTRECKSSSLLFHPPGELHAERFHETGGRSFIIEIAPDWLSQVREYLIIAESSSDFRGGVFSMLGNKLYREFVQLDSASPLILEGAMMQLLGETVRCGAKKERYGSPRWLQQAKELLQARFAENLNLSEIAQNVGVHPVHLAQTFHKIYDCTVGDYVRNLRIEYACRELTSTSKPIVEIALAAGFCDQSHFTRTFKRAVGAAPSQYRESVRNAP